MGFGFDGTVNTVAVDSDGTTYAGGSFTRFGAFTGGAALVSSSTATVTTTFPQVTGDVLAVESDGSGGWFIGGTFTSIGGVDRNGLARIDSTGLVTPFSLDSGLGTTVRALELVGSTLYVGYETSVAGNTFHFLDVVDVTTGTGVGSLPAVNGSVNAIAASTDHLFIGGSFTTVGGTSRKGLARIVPSTGTVDSMWVADLSGGTATVHALAADSLGMVVGGSFTSITDISSIARSNLARVSLNGGIESWAYDTNGIVRAVALRDTTGVIIAGDFTQVAGQTRNKLALLPTAAGSVDPWAPSVTGTSVNSVANVGSTVYAVGDFTNVAGASRLDAVAIDSAGTVTDWSPGLSQQGTSADPTAHAIGVSDGLALIGGTFTMTNTVIRNRVAAVAADGSLVANWNPDIPSGEVHAISISAGYVYIGGAFTLVSGGAVTRNFIARYTTGGALDSTWDPDANGPVEAIVALPYETYVGGSFSTIGGQSRSFIAKLDPNGAAITGWAPQPNAPVTALAIDQNNNRLLFGGSFTQVDSLSRGKGASVNLESGDLDSWDPNFNGNVEAIAVSGKATYFAGSFTTVFTGQVANFVARFYDTTFDTGFAPNPNGPVHAITLVNGTVVLGGTFATVGGSGRNAIGAVDAGGSLVNWTPAVNAPVEALASATNGTVSVGGIFWQSSDSGATTGIRMAQLSKPPTSGLLSATPLAFNDITVGATGNLSITVTNTGALPVSLDHITITTVTQETGTCANGTTIAPLSSCTVNVSWTPRRAEVLSSAAALILEYAGGSVSQHFTITGRSLEPTTPGGGGTTSPTAAVETPTDGNSDDGQTGPNRSLILRPGEVAAVVNGVLLPALGTVGIGNRSLVVAGGGATISVPSPTGLGGSGAPLWQPGLTTTLKVDGFKPGSVIDAYLLSTPQLVGSVTAAATSASEILVSVPGSMATGSHTLQVIGRDTQGRSLIVAVGLTVASKPSGLGTRVYFPRDSFKLTKSAKATLRSMMHQVNAQSLQGSSVDYPTARVIGIVRAAGANVSDTQLARERARSVSQYMRSLGYQGSLRARTAKSPSADRWTDRRVNVSVTWSR